MSFERALYRTVRRKNHLFAVLIMCYLPVMMVLMQQNKTLLTQVAVSRLQYEPRPPNSDVANTERWKKRSSEHQKTTLPSLRRQLFHDPMHPPTGFVTWRQTAQTACDGNFTGYGNKFVRLRNVVLDRHYLLGLNGGEEIKAVINQSEEAEYHKCRYGCFQLTCSKRPEYTFSNNHLTSWLEGLRTNDSLPKDPVNDTRAQFTIMIVRYEYANIYHTMSDFYGAFIVMQFFNRTQHDTNILIVDGHPQGKLDTIWDTLFNSSTRVSSLKMRTHFDDAVWGIMGYVSGMLSLDNDELFLIEEFRKFFLSSHDIVDDHKLDCQHLTVLFIWRHDYLAYPRNPKGVVSRKIANEHELMNFTQTTYPQHRVRVAQIDLYDFKEQLRRVASADILIGMHGAGLTHTVFLPKHAALIELIPSYWSYKAHSHFEAFAKWRHLHYIQWENKNEANELPNSYTNIPTDVLHDLLQKAIGKMCGRHTRQNATNSVLS